MTFWNWGPTTIWHNVESVEFFSKSLHPTVDMAAVIFAGRILKDSNVAIRFK